MFSNSVYSSSYLQGAYPLPHPPFQQSHLAQSNPLPPSPSASSFSPFPPVDDASSHPATQGLRMFKEAGIVDESYQILKKHPLNPADQRIKYNDAIVSYSFNSQWGTYTLEFSERLFLSYIKRFFEIEYWNVKNIFLFGESCLSLIGNEKMGSILASVAPSLAEAIPSFRSGRGPAIKKCNQYAVDLQGTVCRYETPPRFFSAARAAANAIGYLHHSALSLTIYYENNRNPVHTGSLEKTVNHILKKDVGCIREKNAIVAIASTNMSIPFLSNFRLDGINLDQFIQNVRAWNMITRPNLARLMSDLEFFMWLADSYFFRPWIPDWYDHLYNENQGVIAPAWDIPLELNQKENGSINRWEGIRCFNKFELYLGHPSSAVQGEPKPKGVCVKLDKALGIPGNEPSEIVQAFLTHQDAFEAYLHIIPSKNLEFANERDWLRVLWSVTEGKIEVDLQRRRQLLAKTLDYFESTTSPHLIAELLSKILIQEVERQRRLSATPLTSSQIFCFLFNVSSDLVHLEIPSDLKTSVGYQNRKQWFSSTDIKVIWDRLLGYLNGLSGLENEICRLILHEDLLFKTVLAALNVHAHQRLIIGSFFQAPFPISIIDLPSNQSLKLHLGDSVIQISWGFQKSLERFAFHYKILHEKFQNHPESKHLMNDLNAFLKKLNMSARMDIAKATPYLLSVIPADQRPLLKMSSLLLQEKTPLHQVLGFNLLMQCLAAGHSIESLKTALKSFPRMMSVAQDAQYQASFLRQIKASVSFCCREQSRKGIEKLDAFLDGCQKVDIDLYIGALLAPQTPFLNRVALEIWLAEKNKSKLTLLAIARLNPSAAMDYVLREKSTEDGASLSLDAIKEIGGMILSNPSPFQIADLDKLGNVIVKYVKSNEESYKPTQSFIFKWIMDLCADGKAAEAMSLAGAIEDKFDSGRQLIRDATALNKSLSQATDELRFQFLIESFDKAKDLKIKNAIHALFLELVFRWQERCKIEPARVEALRQRCQKPAPQIEEKHELTAQPSPAAASKVKTSPAKPKKIPHWNLQDQQKLDGAKLNQVEDILNRILKPQALKDEEFCAEMRQKISRVLEEFCSPKYGHGRVDVVCRILRMEPVQRLFEKNPQEYFRTCFAAVNTLLEDKTLPQKEHETILTSLWELGMTFERKEDVLELIRQQLVDDRFKIGFPESLHSLALEIALICLKQNDLQYGAELYDRVKSGQKKSDGMKETLVSFLEASIAKFKTTKLLPSKSFQIIADYAQLKPENRDAAIPLISKIPLEGLRQNLPTALRHISDWIEHKTSSQIDTNAKQLIESVSLEILKDKPSIVHLRSILTLLDISKHHSTALWLRLLLKINSSNDLDLFALAWNKAESVKSLDETIQVGSMVFGFTHFEEALVQKWLVAFLYGSQQYERNLIDYFNKAAKPSPSNSFPQTKSEQLKLQRILKEFLSKVLIGPNHYSKMVHGFVTDSPELVNAIVEVYRACASFDSGEDPEVRSNNILLKELMFPIFKKGDKKLSHILDYFKLLHELLTSSSSKPPGEIQAYRESMHNLVFDSILKILLGSFDQDLKKSVVKAISNDFNFILEQKISVDLCTTLISPLRATDEEELFILALQYFEANAKEYLVSNPSKPITTDGKKMAKELIEGGFRFASSKVRDQMASLCKNEHFRNNMEPEYLDEILALWQQASVKNIFTDNADFKVISKSMDALAQSFESYGITEQSPLGEAKELPKEKLDKTIAEIKLSLNLKDPLITPLIVAEQALMEILHYFSLECSSTPNLNLNQLNLVVGELRQKMTSLLALQGSDLSSVFPFSFNALHNSIESLFIVQPSSPTLSLVKSLSMVFKLRQMLELYPKEISKWLKLLPCFFVDGSFPFQYGKIIMKLVFSLVDEISQANILKQDDEQLSLIKEKLTTVFTKEGVYKYQDDAAYLADMEAQISQNAESGIHEQILKRTKTLNWNMKKLVKLDQKKAGEWLVQLSEAHLVIKEMNWEKLELLYNTGKYQIDCLDYLPDNPEGMRVREIVWKNVVSQQVAGLTTVNIPTEKLKREGYLTFLLRFFEIFSQPYRTQYTDVYNEVSGLVGSKYAPILLQRFLDEMGRMLEVKAPEEKTLQELLLLTANEVQNFQERFLLCAYQKTIGFARTVKDLSQEAQNLLVMIGLQVNDSFVKKISREAPEGSSKSSLTFIQGTEMLRDLIEAGCFKDNYREMHKELLKWVKIINDKKTQASHETEDFKIDLRKTMELLMKISKDSQPKTLKDANSHLALVKNLLEGVGSETALHMIWVIPNDIKNSPLSGFPTVFRELTEVKNNATKKQK